MKKVCLFVLGLGMSLSMMAQAPAKCPGQQSCKGCPCHQTVEQRAERDAKMLKDSLSLSKKQYQKAYDMFLNRYKTMEAQRKQYRACPGQNAFPPAHPDHGIKPDSIAAHK